MLTGPTPDAILMVQAVAAFTPRKRVARMPDARFPVEVVGDVPVVGAPEEIDITNATGLRGALLEAAARGQGTFVVDMTRTQFCDSAGLHTLVNAHRRACAEGGAVLLAVSGPAVLRILEITCIDRVVPSFTTLEGALAHAAGAAAQPV
jgi:anti-sigma B factor antagonist